MGLRVVTEAGQRKLDTFREKREKAANIFLVLLMRQVTSSLPISAH